MPHLSYAVLRSFEVEAVREAVTALPGGAPLALHIDAVGHFRRGRVALVPAVTGQVLDRQARVVDAAVATGGDLHHYYRPGWWVPHLSVSTHVRGEDLAWVTTAVHDILPLEVTADRAALVDSGTGQRWPLDVLP